MEDYDFCEELKGIYKHSVFDNETIRYYLNGFIGALGIDLSDGNIEEFGFKKMLDKDNYQYISDMVVKKGNSDEIIVTKNNGKKNWIEIKGKNGNLSYNFVVFYSMRKINKKEILPFEISIEVNEDDYYCSMVIYSRIVTLFNLVRKSKKGHDYYFDNFSFGVNRSDLELCLSTIMKFLENPNNVIDNYKKNEGKSKSFYIETAKIDMESDIILDKNGKKLEKVLK